MSSSSAAAKRSSGSGWKHKMTGRRTRLARSPTCVKLRSNKRLLGTKQKLVRLYHVKHYGQHQHCSACKLLVSCVPYVRYAIVYASTASSFGATFVTSFARKSLRFSSLVLPQPRQYVVATTSHDTTQYVPFDIKMLYITNANTNNSDE